MKNTIVFIAMTFALTFTACKKEKSTSTTSTTTKTTTAMHHGAARWEDASNSDNPYDYVGNWHNQFLDTMVTAGDTVLTDEVNVCHTYCNNHSLFTWNSNEYNIVASALSQFSISSLQTNRFNYLNIKISNWSFSLAAKSYLITLFFTTLDPGQYSQTATYSDLKANMLSLEATISADNSLSESENEMLLGACSVTRYSVYINWTNAGSPTPANIWISPSVSADIAG